MVKIPLLAQPAYTQDVTLEGVAYKIRIKWNNRGQYYTMDFLTKEGAALVSGMKLALNAALLRVHPGRGLPPGEIVVIDSGGDNTVVGQDDIEGRVEVIYMTEAEYAAL